MNRYHTLIILLCLALSGCTSNQQFEMEVTFSHDQLTLDGPKTDDVAAHRLYPDYDEVYLVLVHRFYPRGHSRWYYAWSIANVGNYKTTIHLEGTVFRTFRGNIQPGETINLVETWHVDGRSPHPKDHPVRLHSAVSWMPPVPRILALKQSGMQNIVTIGDTDWLPADIIHECYIEHYQASFDAYVHAKYQQWGRRISQFAIITSDAPPDTFPKVSRDDIELFIRDCIKNGHIPKFSNSWSRERGYWVYVTQGDPLPHARQ